MSAEDLTHVRPLASPPDRSAAEIRASVERTRGELSHTVEQLRLKVGELTDWRRQMSEHRNEIVVGAAVVGFLAGGMLVARRRRRRA